MGRAAASTDFVVEVDGIGRFVVARRQMADHLKVQVAYANLVEGVIPTPWLHELATHMATLQALVVRAPDGFDMDALDPLDEASFEKLRKVYRAIAEKEDSFRPRAKASEQGTGQASS